MIIQNEAPPSSLKARREPMMIRTDLFAAILHEKRRFNQPGQESFTKVVVGGIAVLVLAGAAHYFYLTHQLGKLRPQAVDLSSKAEFMERDLQNARLRLQLQREKVARRSVLLGFAEKRTPIAPLLEKVFAATPSHVELTSLRASCSNPESLTLVISGQTGARNARLECDKFRLLLIQALQDAGINVEGKFANLEEAPEITGIVLTRFSIELTTAAAKPSGAANKTNPRKNSAHGK